MGCDELIHEIFRKVVAKICLSIGYDTIQPLVLYMLADVLKRKLLELGQMFVRYSEIAGYPEPNICVADVVLRQAKISPNDIADYLQCFEFENFNFPVEFPLRGELEFHFRKPSIDEIANRPAHIPEYLPSMTITAPLPETLAIPSAETPNCLPNINEDTSLMPSAKKANEENANNAMRSSFHAQLLTFDISKQAAAREIKNAYMTASGYLSASARGKEPEPMTSKIASQIDMHNKKTRARNNDVIDLTKESAEAFTRPTNVDENDTPLTTTARKRQRKERMQRMEVLETVERWDRMEKMEKRERKERKERKERRERREQREREDAVATGQSDTTADVVQAAVSAADGEIRKSPELETVARPDQTHKSPLVITKIGNDHLDKEKIKVFKKLSKSKDVANSSAVASDQSPSPPPLQSQQHNESLAAHGDNQVDSRLNESFNSSNNSTSGGLTIDSDQPQFDEQQQQQRQQLLPPPPKKSEKKRGRPRLRTESPIKSAIGNNNSGNSNAPNEAPPSTPLPPTASQQLSPNADYSLLNDATAANSGTGISGHKRKRLSFENNRNDSSSFNQYADFNTKDSGNQNQNCSNSALCFSEDKHKSKINVKKSDSNDKLPLTADKKRTDAGGNGHRNSRRKEKTRTVVKKNDDEDDERGGVTETERYERHYASGRKTMKGGTAAAAAATDLHADAVDNPQSYNQFVNMQLTQNFLQDISVPPTLLPRQQPGKTIALNKLPLDFFTNSSAENFLMNPATSQSTSNYLERSKAVGAGSGANTDDDHVVDNVGDDEDDDDDAVAATAAGNDGDRDRDRERSSTDCYASHSFSRRSKTAAEETVAIVDESSRPIMTTAATESTTATATTTTMTKTETNLDRSHSYFARTTRDETNEPTLVQNSFNNNNEMLMKSHYFQPQQQQQQPPIEPLKICTSSIKNLRAPHRSNLQENFVSQMSPQTVYSVQQDQQQQQEEQHHQMRPSLSTPTDSILLPNDQSLTSGAVFQSEDDAAVAAAAAAKLEKARRKKEKRDRKEKKKESKKKAKSLLAAGDGSEEAIPKLTLKIPPMNSFDFEKNLLKNYEKKESKKKEPSLLLYNSGSGGGSGHVPGLMPTAAATTTTTTAAIMAGTSSNSGPEYGDNTALLLSQSLQMPATISNIVPHHHQQHHHHHHQTVTTVPLPAVAVATTAAAVATNTPFSDTANCMTSENTANTSNNNSDVAEDTKFWNCPVCVQYYENDDAMVCCDSCNYWHHWKCVGLNEAPVEEKWFCSRCEIQMHQNNNEKRNKRRNTKNVL